MKLKSIVPWGRSLQEYKNIFALTEADLKKSILGCGDGPASFNAELTAQGGNVVSADPVYCFNAKQLQSRIAEVYDEVIGQLHLNKEKYIWHSIASVEELGHVRMSSMNQFIQDFERGKEAGRYIEASLPCLPFSDNQFDLALCSHYLFLYSEQVSFDAHLQSLKELCRVAKEVRVYPLVTLKGELSPFVDAVISALNKQAYSATLVESDYRFQKGATQMLQVSC